MFNSVRVRLTLWYVLVCGLLLIGFSLFIYVVLSKNLYARLDHSLSNATQTATSAFQTEVAENGGNVEAGAQEALSELRLPDVYIAIYKGKQLLAADYPEGQLLALPENTATVIRAGNQVAFTTIDGFGEEGARVAIATVNLAATDYLVVVTEPLHDLVEQLEAIRRTFYFGMPATLLVAGLGGFVLARKSLAPVVAMSDQAARISAKNLHERLRVNNESDELGHLASVLNELLSRLNRSFENMREFMADASHELRTPLSIIRGEADVALSQDRDSTDYKDALAIIQDEARRLSRLVDDLLVLARADAGQRPLQIGEFYLNDLVEECCRAAQVLAAQKGLSLGLESSPDIPFRGDEDVLRRMVLNLLDNAVKYTPADGTVCVTLVAEAARVKIIVMDTGIGVPAEAAAQIFERFYRIRRARSRADGGSGLGLAIARWAAEAHHGSIALASQPDQGSTFTVTLPR
jgi:heavy metal sensor kinase